jgi:hypothetical protein
MFCVYCHTNKKNGKKYVGITSQKPEQRWNNGKGYIANKGFYKDIQKYGWDGFDHEILADGLSQDAAVVAEAELIRKWDCYNSGYNRCVGGRYGKQGFLSPQNTIIKNNLKRYDYMDEYHELFEMANNDKRLGDWLNYFMPIILQKLGGGMRLTDEIDLVYIMNELYYVMMLEYSIVTGTEKPEYKTCGQRFRERVRSFE